MRTTSLFAQKLPDFDTDSWEYSRKDSGLERLALDAGQTGEQRGRGYEIAPVPRAIFAALFDDVQLVANLERQIGRRGGLEGIYTDPEGDSG
jgi:hypothetical protein